MAVVDVDTIAAFLGRPAAQAVWLGPKVVDHVPKDSNSKNLFSRKSCIT